MPLARRAFRRVAATVTSFVLLAVTGGAAAGQDASPPAPLTLEQRTAARLALDRVDASHETWNEALRGPRPAFDEARGREVAAREAEETLRMSAALTSRYGVTFTGDQLQAELDRMARTSLAPARLAEYFAALSNDPHLAAECLARPVLTENTLRQRYAWDEKVHAALHERATQGWADAAAGTPLNDIGGSYSESEWMRVTDPASVAGKQPEPVDGPTYLDDAGWKRLQDRLRSDLGLDGSPTVRLRAGALGVLQENSYSYFGESIVAATPDRIRVARVVWLKQDFGAWLRSQRSAATTEIAEPAYAYRLPAPGEVRASAAGGDRWKKMTSAGAPSPRSGHQAVWTDSKMEVRAPAAGGDRWKKITSTGAPSARSGHQAVWTGSKMVVWGGWDGSTYFDTGGIYDPATNSWTATSTTNAPAGRRLFTAILDTSPPEMVVWGGYGGANFSDGGVLDVNTDTWSGICGFASAPCRAPEGRHGHTMVDTGLGYAHFTVWGGAGSSSSLDTGGAWFAAENSWEATDVSDPDVPSPRFAHTALHIYDWGQRYMVVWGGGDRLSSGGRMVIDDAATNRWLPVTTLNAPPGRDHHAAVKVPVADESPTSNAMLVWGGYTWGSEVWSAQGGSYRPYYDEWSLLSTDGAPEGRENLGMVWSGHEVILWGGDQTSSCTDTGGRYNPESDSWVRTDRSDPDTPSARTDHTAVWAGDGMIVWGGYDLTDRLGDGAIYRSCYADPTDPGMPWVQAYEDDKCSASGIRVAWDQDIPEWGDYDRSAGRDYIVLRDGAPLPLGGCSGTLPYGTTSCVDDTAVPGTTYLYRVVYVNSCGGTYTSASAFKGTDLTGSDPVVTAVPSVTDLDGCTADSGLQITWPSQPGGDWGDNWVTSGRAYRVWRWDAVNGWTALGDRQTETTYSDLTTQTGTQYQYKVRYINGCGLATDTAASGAVEDGAGSPPAVSQTAVAADADQCDHTGIRVSWPQDPDDWGDGGTGDRLYRVRRSADGVTFDPIGTNLAYGTTSYLDTNANPDQTYYYQVRYKNGCGASTDSGAASAADTASTTPVVSQTAAAVDRDACDSTGIRVSWPQDPDDWGDDGTGDRHYRVRRSTDGVSFSSILSDVAYGTTHLLDTGANPGQTYYYEVRYKNACGLAADSGAASATDNVGTAPTGLAAVSAVDPDGCVDGGVGVTWSVDAGDWGDSGSGTRSYDVLRDGTPVASGIAYGTSTYTDATGANGTTYSYTVRYANGCGLTAATDGAAGVDLPTDPSLTVSNNQAEDLDPASYSGVRITWSQDPDGGWGDDGASAGRTYEVLRDGTSLQSDIAYGTTELVDDTALPGTSYVYSVRYRNCGGLYVETAGATASDDNVSSFVFDDGFELGDTSAWSLTMG